MHSEDTWRQWLLRKALCFCHCEADADDLVQDCLHAFYRHFGFYPWQRPMEGEELRSARAWCLCKLRSLAIDRAQQPHRQHELLLLDTEVGEYLAIDNPEEALLLRIAMKQFIASLPAYLKKVAVLYNRGYNYAEIAQALNKSVGVVQQYLQRVKRLGREFFGLEVNKSAVLVVNIDGSPVEGLLKRTEEEVNDEQTEGLADERSGVDDSESGGVADDSRRPRGTERGGGLRCRQALCLAKVVVVPEAQCL